MGSQREGMLLIRRIDELSAVRTIFLWIIPTCIGLVCLPDHEVGAVAVHQVAVGGLPQYGDVHVRVNSHSEQIISEVTYAKKK